MNRLYTWEFKGSTLYNLLRSNKTPEYNVQVVSHSHFFDI